MPHMAAGPAKGGTSMMLNRRLVSIILVIAGIFGFLVALILAIGFAAHGGPDKWLIPLSGVLGFLGVLLALL